MEERRSNRHDDQSSIERQYYDFSGSGENCPKVESFISWPIILRSVRMKLAAEDMYIIHFVLACRLKSNNFDTPPGAKGRVSTKAAKRN